MIGKNTKKILIVDDSALMRRILCDIITADDDFEVADMASNGEVALELLEKNHYDAMLLDMVMPRMDGITLLKELNRRHYRIKVIVSSTIAEAEGDITMEALSLGAVDFIKKPQGVLDAKGKEFGIQLTEVLRAVLGIRGSSTKAAPDVEKAKETVKYVNVPSRFGSSRSGWGTVVAIASSTGGPKALQEVIPHLPGNLNAPIVLVQHMPVGFTASLAERLNSVSELTVQEASPGVELKKGNVYIAKGGTHQKLEPSRFAARIVFGDEPSREGVKPCANYMYESLASCGYDRVVCVVMTGMGADGTEGIIHLKESKPVYVISQNQATCAVYGMPRAIAETGLVSEVVPLSGIAQAITKNVGVI